MTAIKKTVRTLSQLREHILTRTPTLFTASRTSTVIAFGKLERDFQLVLADISLLPKKLKLLENGNLQVGGGVTWQEARDYLKNFGKDVLAYPTEQLAQVTASIATSATGERSFHYGPIRDHLVSLIFMDHQGLCHTLHANKKCLDYLNLKASEKKLFAEYQKHWNCYRDFKNGPFPRLEYETDFFCQTEGQLGVILEAEIKVADLESTEHIVIPLPRWEEDISFHLKIYHQINKLKNLFYAVEFLDANSIGPLAINYGLKENSDYLFLEVPTNTLLEVMDKVLGGCLFINPADVFEFPASKYHQLRVAVPLSIGDKLSHNLGIKKGTDAQVGLLHFKDLLEFYQKWAKQGVDYVLFGHFGDTHLHFNFIPKNPEAAKLCDTLLQDFYIKVQKWKGSPFAEHGIGLLKKDFISKFHGKTEKEVFKILKNHFDPHHQFFPLGYL